MSNNTVEEIDHTADLAIRVRGRDLRELFSNAALGMATLMAEVKTIELDVERHVELDAFDIETLLVSWLSELLWFHEESEAMFVRCEIEKLTSTQLEATVWGGAVSCQWNHIKAVTFHDLKIAETDQGYEVTLVFDV